MHHNSCSNECNRHTHARRKYKKAQRANKNKTIETSAKINNYIHTNRQTVENEI